MALGKHFNNLNRVSSSAVFVITDSLGNKNYYVNAGVACKSDNTVFHPLYASNISLLKVLVQFIAYSMSVCYRQVGGGFLHKCPSQKQQILFFQIRIQSPLHFWCLESERALSPQTENESNTPVPFLLHILEMVQRSWCSEHD